MARRGPFSETPPRDLDDEAKALWKATIEALTEQGTWRPSDVPTLERYVRAAHRAREARDGETTTRGSQGQLVQHPNVKTAREAELDAHRYAEALILTPEARRRHGVADRSPEPDDW